MSKSNRLGKGGPGGGPGSKQVVKQGVRTGATPKAAHVAGVAQVGQQVGDHTMKGSVGYRGEALFKGAGFGGVPHGNEVASQTVCGPGGSRTIYRTGVQSTHGGVDPGKSTPRRDILSEYGPESKR